MGDSLRSFADAVEAFGERLAAVAWWPLAIALGFVLLNLLLRTRAWRNIIAAAYPDSRVRWRHAFGAYAAGVAVNKVLPARVGDPVKLMLMHRRVEGATYPTLAATLVAETLVDAVVASALMVGAWRAGLLPVLPDLPELPAFEVSWVADHPWVAGLVAALLLVAVLVASRHVRAFWARVRQGLVILTMPVAYLRRVALLQLLGWVCRFASAWFFLEAFHIPPTIEAVVLVQVASSAATLMPATPGGVGPKQALLVIVLAGEAARPDVLAFSVGMEAASAAFSLVVGFGAMAVMLGGLRFRSALRAARHARDGGDEPPGGPPDAGVGAATRPGQAAGPAASRR